LQNNTFSTLFVGQNIVTLRRIDSTNNYLKNQLSKSAPLPEGTVILAEEQFAGRGQLNNTWISEPGMNLTLSLLLFPTFLNPEQQFLLNKSISIAINDVLARIIGAGLKIKWPNDIYFKDKKVGGVLIENLLRGRRWNYAVVGIGININQTHFPDTIKKVTSIKEILQKNYDINDILVDLCTSIEQRYLQLRAGKYDLLDQMYIKNLYKYNEPHIFEINGEQKEGKIIGISDTGMLEVNIDEKIGRYNFKEIAFI